MATEHFAYGIAPWMPKQRRGIFRDSLKYKRLSKRKWFVDAHMRIKTQREVGCCALTPMICLVKIAPRAAAVIVP
jgi:hypothetical protein